MGQQTFAGPIDELAIELLQFHEQDALKMHPAGYWVGDSGGKDSVVIKDLVRRAGVKHEIWHNLTTVDPPELVRFIKRDPEVNINRSDETMSQIIRRKGLPPRRNARFCCELLKETGGGGRLVVDGVRWGESNRRSRRRQMEACFRDKSKILLHPILTWTTEDVWGYIRERELDYCSLYDEGFKRLGCVLCPMKSNPADIKIEVERWPKIAAMWEKAVKATFDPKTKDHGFKDAQEYWEWWLWKRRSRTPLNRHENDPVLFEDDPNIAD